MNNVARSIKDLTEKIKGFAEENRLNLRPLPDELFLGLLIILVAFASFGLGRLSKIEGSKSPIRIENAESADSRLGQESSPETFPRRAKNASANALSPGVGETTGSQLVGSKNGKKYYYSWCSGVQKISPANLINFSSKGEAEARGYTPSATCKGL